MKKQAFDYHYNFYLNVPAIDINNENLSVNIELSRINDHHQYNMTYNYTKKDATKWSYYYYFHLEELLYLKTFKKKNIMPGFRIKWKFADESIESFQGYLDDHFNYQFKWYRKKHYVSKSK